jgi:cation:H+ antiporter
MFGFDFMGLSPWLNGIIFVAAAVVVWLAGTRLSFMADAIAERTKLGQALVGLLLLAVATSLPEIGTTVSAALRGNAGLVTNNIFGGITLQTVMLALVDLWVVRGALTYFSPRPVLLLEGVFLVLLLALALAAVAAGEFVMFFQVGLWSVLLLGAYLVSLILIHRYEVNERWQPADAEARQAVEDAVSAIRSDTAANSPHGYGDWPLRRLLLFFGVGSAFILGGGVVLALVSEALAEQTGLGTSFVGATLLAGSTSLPELSTTLAAARLGNYSMAISNIFGSNALMVLLLFVADLFYREGAILDAVGASSIFAAAMGIVVTAVYLAGLIEWKDRTIRGMGVDSAVVFGIYAGNVVVLYLLR